MEYNNYINTDYEIWSIIKQEYIRQSENINLIASENYASSAVMTALGSILTNKYAEGYPGNRYYGGCENIDVIENLAIFRSKYLFKADFANVQPHSGSQANAGAYLACINAGDTIMGMDITSGGHLTHGAKVSFSGQIFRAIHYGLDSITEEINYNQVRILAHQYKPKLIIAGGSAYSRVIDWVKFRQIANEINAFLIADIAHVAGLIVSELYPSPISIADITTATTHKTLRGPRGGLILAKHNPKLENKLNASIFPGQQGGPMCHVIAAKAISFKEAMSNDFKIYQKQVIKNAKIMANIIINRGYKIVSGGTDSHLFLINLLDKNITGKDALQALASANIIVNKNQIPNDQKSPFITSGIRIGTPAITTRGFKDNEAEIIAVWICDILDNIHNIKNITKIKRNVMDICEKYPIPSGSLCTS